MNNRVLVISFDWADLGFVTHPIGLGCSFISLK